MSIRLVLFLILINLLIPFDKELRESLNYLDMNLRVDY